MLVFVIILLIVAIAIVAGGIVFGVFRIEKVAVEEDQTDFPLPDEEAEDAGLDLDDGVSLKDKMDLSGYFGDESEGSPEAAADKPDKAGKADEADEAQSDRFSNYDPLCELKTGRGYLIDCQKALNEAKSSGDLFAAFWFDFDRFRFINNLRGLSIGDYILTRTGQELEGIFPQGSQITRVSADHFAAVFPVDTHDLFPLLDERLRDVCEKLRVDMALKSSLRVRAGVAVTDTDADFDISVLLHKAGIARHCIKTSRSETWKLFENSMISTCIYGESALEDYSENQYDDDFVIYYSPQMDVALRGLTGCEALVRWICEDEATKGLPQSMSKGKIPTNTRKVIYQVCKAMSRWRKAGKQAQPVSVSIPPQLFYLDDLDAFLGKCLSEFQLEPGLLAIVVDAPLVRLDWSSASRQLKKLRDLGVLTGVDEIDLGYSNLDFLEDLPFTFIKLHRSFAADIHHNDERREAARKMLDAARQKKLRVIFEGVDVQDQARTLQELGASEIQGHYCGAPQKSEEFLHGLPDYIEKNRLGAGTVILDDVSLNRGDYTVF